MLSKAEATAFQSRIRNDPEWFSTEILKRPLWEKEREIMLALRDHNEVSVRSCNASGKSYTAGSIVHWWLLGNEDAVVITTAPTGRQVKEVLWREIKSACAGKNLYPKDAVLDVKINVSEKWFALGLSTDTPDQFQGFHSPHLLAVVDEASGIEPTIFEAIDGLKPEKILFLGNPMRTSGRFADSFKDVGVRKIAISAFDTPNVQAGRVVIPGLVAQEDVERIERKYGKESDVYRVRVLGEFPRAESDVLISMDDVAKAIERTVDVNKGFEKKMGVDIARYGDDRSAVVIRQKENVTRKEILIAQDTVEMAGHVIRIAKEENVLPTNINIDIIGLGVGTFDALKHQGWHVNGVNVSVTPDDTEHYANKRAELYGRVKEWIATGSLIQDEDWYELTNIKYKFTANGKMLMESKEDMKKRGLSSPDVADALMLTFDTSTFSYGEASSLEPGTPLSTAFGSASGMPGMV